MANQSGNISVNQSEKIYKVNLEELVSNYVWGKFKRNKNFIRKLFLRRADYQFDIRWGYVAFSHETNPEDENTPGPSGSTKPTEKSSKPESTTLSVIQATEQQVVPDMNEANKKNVQLYFSEYENKTKTTQVYKFTTTRQTTETTKLEMQENYTIGAKTNLSVNLGKIVSLGAEVTGSLSVTETKAQEFSKSLTWSIDTEIKVPRWHKAEAKLLVYEIPTEANFVVKTTMSLPTGSLPVSIIRIKDGKEVYVGWILDLKVLFDEAYRRRSTVKVFEKTIERNGRQKIVNMVELTTRGICRHIGFRNQHVEVKCDSIPNAPADLPPLSDEES